MRWLEICKGGIDVSSYNNADTFYVTILLHQFWLNDLLL